VMGAMPPARVNVPDHLLLRDIAPTDHGSAELFKVQRAVLAITNGDLTRLAFQNRFILIIEGALQDMLDCPMVMI
jgi:hypothetical protein